MTDLSVSGVLEQAKWAVITPSPDDYRDAEQLVAHHLPSWGWGQVEDFDGLAEHVLAVDACAVGLSFARQAAAKAREDAK